MSAESRRVLTTKAVGVVLVSNSPLFSRWKLASWWRTLPCSSMSVSELRCRRFF
jgi:hypothetical protein